jgi:hypothetical protein
VAHDAHRVFAAAIPSLRSQPLARLAVVRACEYFDFWNFGMSKINDLRGQNPKKSN